MQWAEELKKEYEKIAKVNQGTRNDLNISTTLDEGFRTDEAIAEDLDMGKTTYRKAQFITENASEDMIKQLDDGQLSINPTSHCILSLYNYTKLTLKCPVGSLR